jgi:hypothetical protein
MYVPGKPDMVHVILQGTDVEFSWTDPNDHHSSIDAFEL